MPYARVLRSSQVIAAERSRTPEEGLDKKATWPYALLLSGNRCCATGGNWLLSSCMPQISPACQSNASR